MNSVNKIATYNKDQELKNSNSIPFNLIFWK